MRGLLLTLLFCVAGCVVIEGVKAEPISGTISLPGNQVAPSGMLISVNATDVSGNGLGFQSINVSLAQGESSLDFRLENIPDNPNGSWRIRYACFNNFIACRNFVLTGYYDSTKSGNSSFRESDATPVRQGTSNVDFSLIEGIRFSGSLISPAGPAPAEGIDTQVFVSSTDFSISENIRFSIEEGQSDVDFSFTMPEGENLDYRVRYQCDPTTSSSGICSSLFLGNGFYQSNVVGNAVSDSADAELLVGNQSYTNLDMTLISGASISGTISRLLSTSTANPVAFFIRAVDQSGGEPDAFTSIDIPIGQRSADYALVVDPNPASNWQLRITCSTTTEVACQDYGQFSFYDADNPPSFTTADTNNADALAGNINHEDINLIPVPSASISGVIMLPDGVFAPAGGATLLISAQNTNGSQSFNSTEVTVPQGASSIDYSLPIARIDDAQWLLSVRCEAFLTPQGCRDITDLSLYYDTDSDPNFTTVNFAESDRLSGAASFSAINMILIPAEKISGVLTLGNGQTAPAGGLVVRVTARGFLNDVQESTVFNLLTIAEGVNQQAYSLSLPNLGLDGWTLEFQCDQGNPPSNCSSYSPQSFYSANAPDSTSPNQSAASLVNLTTSQSNINVTLLAQSDQFCIPIKAANGSIALICL